MTDQPHEDFEDVDDEAGDAPGENAAPEPVESTGHPAVDEVLRSLESLGEIPVDEHVPVFEQAHDELRRTLQGAGDDQD